MSDEQVYLQVKHLVTGEPAGEVMGPMSDDRAGKVTMGALINMSPEYFVDEWPESDGPNGPVGSAA